MCRLCNKADSKYSGLCQGCYRYFKNGGMVYGLPAPGVVERDPDGKPICHICGRSYVRLGSHVKESHGMTIADYKAVYGLCSSANTTEAAYSAKMSDNAYIHNMPLQLITNGKMTRIKKGENDKRKNKPVRLQERLEKRSRRKQK